MTLKARGRELQKVFDLLLESYGRQEWWPADSAFEVMVGAVLTQNTAWSNVERAITNLKQAKVLHQRGILALSREDLAELIRPSGYFNVKAQRLQNLCRFLAENGGECALREADMVSARKMLLSVNGVGAETADDIMLYALDKPVFVVDAYTRRIFSRLGMLQGDEKYDEIRVGFEQALGPHVLLFKEYHALIVSHGKETCKTKPHCDQCGLVAECLFGSNRQ
jgi:endonuclease III related protein